MAKLAAQIILEIFLGVSVVSARTVKQFVGPNIPLSIATSSAGIFLGSDTLKLGSAILERDRDYHWDRTTNRFVLIERPFGPGDTLTVIYTTIPAWAMQTFGREIPEPSSAGNPPPIPQINQAPATSGAFVQNIKLSGAKTFRFSALNGGTTDFGQSLDLHITGELSPGLELSGALSDRGYDPVYGTANSRLNELDKVNLQLKSQALLVRMGDIVLQNDMVPRSKSISGAMFELQYPNWRVNAAAARPKGRFATVKFQGDDSYQGPYQINSGTGVQPVVPGSETVWLDGRRLDRGADKDYSVDYPSGLITFSPKNPIDRRSRIEIDFEPSASTYRQQLLVAGGGINRSDSSFFASVEAIREGDNKDQPLTAALSDSDKALLQQAGDTSASRSGVVTDTLGSYTLVRDSLPDTVFQYVGTRNGAYSITFTYVGPGKGTYRFLGGGDYQFVGKGQGDYLPIVILPRPEQTDYYRGLIGLRSKVFGELTADLRQTRYDRNLFSVAPSLTQNGTFYNLQLSKKWGGSGGQNEVTIRRRLLEPQFHFQDRIDQPDFSRDFLLPPQFAPTSNEALNEVKTKFCPASWGELSPFYLELDYAGRFRSRTGGSGLHMKLSSRLDVAATWKEIASRYSLDTAARSGRADNFFTNGSYTLTGDYKVQGEVEFDRRRNDYSGQLGGTRFLRWSTGLANQTESVSYENYVEDSLTLRWDQSAIRRRVAAHSTRRLQRFTYDATAAWQWLNEPSQTQRSFLGRTNFSYSDPARQLQVTSSYTLSSELRNAQGIAYLQVDQGRGTYSLINGQYVPDANGNYIQIEEVLSDRQLVRRGEKSLTLSKAGKAYSLRFDANIDEELLPTGKRTVVWLVPFYSDAGQPYLYLERRYNSDFRFLPIAGVYAVNISLADDLERRDIAGSPEQRRDSRGSLGLKQAAGIIFLEETLDLFSSRRDNYYTGAGNISGFKAGGTIRRTRDKLELSVGGTYRQASSELGESAKTYSGLLGTRVQLNKRGEVRLDLELYSQKLNSVGSLYSYQLTDNRYGSRGALWNASYSYSVRSNVKINASLDGRHSDDRAGRVTGRAEVVAGF